MQSSSVASLPNEQISRPRFGRRKRRIPWRRWPGDPTQGRAAWGRNMTENRPNDPLLWNTLDEAADYLSIVTGAQWSPNAVLSAALEYYNQGHPQRPRPTWIKAAPPRSTEFGFYLWDTKAGTPANPFVRQYCMPWHTLPLYPVHLSELLATGETRQNIARKPNDDYGQEGQYVFIEPLEAGFTVTRPMLGMTRDGLLGLLSAITSKKMTPAKTSKTWQEAPGAGKDWASLTPEQKRAAWQAMGKAGRQDKAHELVRLHQGNKTAAGREVGISGNRIGQILKEAEEQSEHPEAELPVNHYTVAAGLVKPKRGRASR